MKKLIHRFFGMFGLEVRRKQPVAQPVRTGASKVPGPDSMMAGMLRAKNNWKINPRTVIDLGAAAGTWSEKAINVWKHADYLLFEPLEERKAELLELAGKFPNVRPVFVAVGDHSGKVSFRVSGDLDGSAIAEAGEGGETREVDLMTLNDAVAQKECSGPYLIKFDTHGFELPILSGANNVLPETELVIMECYGFTLTKESLQFSEMCTHMHQLGFRVADIVDSMRRPDDQVYWQCDIFFLRHDHPVFKRNTYAA